MRFQAPPPPAPGPVLHRIAGRSAAVGGATVRRLLPVAGRRLIGAWCFVDHFGPTRSAGPGMGIGPHPHIGLQTVTWLLSGCTRHRDSLGTDQRITAGQVNWMTAGRGIAHAEDGETPAGEASHGLQLWVALPDAARHGPPAFEHVARPPVVDLQGACGTVFAGRFGDAVCPATTHTPLVGLDLPLPDGAPRSLPLDPGFEHGALVVDGEVLVAGERVTPGTLLYLGQGRTALSVVGLPAGRLILLGGAPLREPVRMWWNFVFREPDELRAAVAAWNGGDASRFPPVVGSPSPRIPAPVLPGRLPPR